MDAVTSLTVPLVSVQSLGAVQHVSILDGDALRYVTLFDNDMIGRRHRICCQNVQLLSDKCK